jgi:hypothetical protein|tara:strand:- start:245 stop:706 length:462 start_codon:yes stop_codon:yes gene_type:complete
MRIFDLLEDASRGKGSKAGREKYTSKEGAKKKGATKAVKSRSRIYDTIAKALQSGKVGEIFSTKGSDRLYVISKAGWGKKSSGKIAKGFTKGSSTPSSDFKSVKAHAARTMLKHGSSKSGRLKKLYGPGAKNKIDNSKKAVSRGTKGIDKGES